MVVDGAGQFVSQRELPRMALVQPTLKSDEMVLRAPGMLALHLRSTASRPRRATVWNDTVAAYDMGELCAQWFSDFLGRPLRLARFDPDTSAWPTAAGPARSTPRTRSTTASRCSSPRPRRWPS